ncbi:MAG: amidophosphoribosyltransferase, partial [Dehalococcoidia bacterium]
MPKTNRPIPFDDDSPRDECGIVGVYAPGEDVARIAFFGLFALQHRGQESAGIAATDGNGISRHTAMGLITQVFREEDLSSLTGHMAIGHTRYSTTGAPRRINAQPIMARGPDLTLAMGHNGNVINAASLRAELTEWGATFEGATDTEVIAEMYARAPGSTWEQRSAYCMRRLKGAYSLVILTKDEVVGVRDPLGIRPLCLGRLDNGYVLASESCAIDHVGGTFERELVPGETVVINAAGVHSTVW